MGFFSWKTSDTNKSISNRYSSRGALPVYVLCPDGTKIKETNYEGYGVFGSEDIFVLVAKWNYPDSCKDANGDWLSDDIIRDLGLDVSYDVNAKYGIKIVEDGNLNYDDVGVSECCPEQGFFYDDGLDEADEDDDWCGQEDWDCED